MTKFAKTINQCIELVVLSSAQYIGPLIEWVHHFPSFIQWVGTFLRWTPCFWPSKNWEFPVTCPMTWIYSNNPKRQLELHPMVCKTPPSSLDVFGFWWCLTQIELFLSGANKNPRCEGNWFMVNILDIIKSHHRITAFDTTLGIFFVISRNNLHRFRVRKWGRKKTSLPKRWSTRISML